jgi:uncharacterized membrane-anchored protein YitT (DUF2179 family)
MLAGLIYGAWVDGMGAGWIVLYLATFLGLLALALYLMNKHNTRNAETRMASSHSSSH